MGAAAAPAALAPFGAALIAVAAVVSTAAGAWLQFKRLLRARARASAQVSAEEPLPQRVDAPPPEDALEALALEPLRHAAAPALQQAVSAPFPAVEAASLDVLQALFPDAAPTPGRPHEADVPLAAQQQDAAADADIFRALFPDVAPA